MWSSQQPAHACQADSEAELGSPQKAKRFFRALVSLDVLLTIGAVSNAIAYLHNENRSQTGTVFSSVLIIFFVVDVIAATLMWHRIPSSCCYSPCGVNARVMAQRPGFLG
mmetsp:Transcript_116342/g.231943  ORF Transcript_116342/g.231943 Transcript_116342/m.231943 type:complete len:110 (-) Transcript_116342:140-469(-)